MTLALAALALLGGGAPQDAAAPPPVVEVAEPAPRIELAANTAPAFAETPAPAVAETKAPSRRQHTKGDPLEGFNRAMFNAHQKFDHAILRPAALGYRHAVPKPARSGIRNFFSNLTEPIVFLNYMLQFKPGKAMETFGRFALNSTVGIGGLLDVAKRRGVSLPHRDNGFGNTLAFYGVKPGPYLFLPFVGPTTLRDFIGGQGDGLILPTVVGKPFNRLEYQIPKAVLTGLDRRAEADEDLTALFDGAVDPYATLRSVYLQDREGELDRLRGKHLAQDSTTPELGEALDDPAGEGAPSPGSGPSELSGPLADPGSGNSPTGSEALEPLVDPAAPKP